MAEYKRILFSNVNPGDFLVRYQQPTTKSTAIIVQVQRKSPREVVTTPVDLTLVMRMANLSAMKFLLVSSAKRSIISQATINSRFYLRFETITELVRWATITGHLVPQVAEQLRFNFDENTNERWTLNAFSAKVANKVCKVLATDGHLLHIIGQCSREALQEMNTLKGRKK